MARLDCPRQWPELIPILLESVKGQDGLQQHRALLTFYHVTKTLASKRLAQDRRLFQDVSPHCCASVRNVSWTLLAFFIYTTICWYKAESCHTIRKGIFLVFLYFFVFNIKFIFVSFLIGTNSIVFSLSYFASRRCCLASVCNFKVEINDWLFYFTHKSNCRSKIVCLWVWKTERPWFYGKVS